PQSRDPIMPAGVRQESSPSVNKDTPSSQLELNIRRQLYIPYDTFEFEDAFEVPTALLIALGVAVVGCLAIWFASEVRYPTFFNGYLYKVILRRFL
ncbi:hypothetical protein BG015_001227, partial [Linnemannia schmuckeri]